MTVQGLERKEMPRPLLPVPIEEIVDNGGHRRKDSTVVFDPEGLDVSMSSDPGLATNQTRQSMDVRWNPELIGSIHLLTERCVAMELFFSP
jgi:hypothetical protein